MLGDDAADPARVISPGAEWRTITEPVPARQGESEDVENRLRNELHRIHV